MRSVSGVLRRAVLLAAAFASVAAATASAHDRGVVGHVYVNDNTAGINTIAAFARHADGRLTPLPGSPFGAGGAGTGTTIGSQGALEIADHGRYLLAVDAGSNQISVLRIRRDGGLRLVGHGPVASGGIEPVSIAVHRHLVYVANTGAGGTDYTGFWLGRGGRLSPIGGSTVVLPPGSAPGDVLFNATGANLAGTRVGTSLIDSFAVGRDGLLTAAPGSPYAAQTAGPFGSEFRPTDPSQLFVTNAHGGPGTGSVSAFSVAGDGTLSSIGTSPFANGQTGTCWVEISHDGRYLFAVDTATPSISRYAVAGDGSLTLLGNTPFQGSGKLGPFDARLSPDGGTLWVVDSARAVSGFRVDGGNLDEFASSPQALPADSAPFGIVVN